MAELLIFTRNNNINAGSYKRGDIVEVREDGTPYGSEELRLFADGGKFVRLKLPGVSVAAVEAYTAPEYVLQNPSSGLIKRRLWGFLIDNIPAGVKDILLNTGEYTTTPAAIKAFIRHKNTDEEASI